MEDMMVEQWRRDCGIAEHLMVEQWNIWWSNSRTCDSGRVEDLVVEQCNI